LSTHALELLITRQEIISLMTPTYAIVLLVALAFLLFFQLGSLQEGLKNYTSLRTYESDEYKGQEPTPEQVEEITGELNKIGFRHVGRIETPQFNELIKNPDYYDEVYIDKPGSTYALIGAHKDKVYAAMYTLFGDLACVQTNIGSSSGRTEEVIQDDFLYQAFGGDMPDVYEAHIENINKLKETFGEPDTAEDLAAVLELTDLYHDGFVQRRMTRSLRPLILGSGGASLAFIGGGFAAWRNLREVVRQQGQGLDILLLVAVILAGLYGLLRAGGAFLYLRGSIPSVASAAAEDTNSNEEPETE